MSDRIEPVRPGAPSQEPRPVARVDRVARRPEDRDREDDRERKRKPGPGAARPADRGTHVDELA